MSSTATASAASVVVVPSPVTTAMDIGETAFRPDEISKGDFFDFVSAPVTSSVTSQLTLGTSNGTSSSMAGSGLNNGHDCANGTTPTSSIDHQQQQQQPLQGYDQFWGTDKDRLDAGVFEDLNRFCWSQQQQQQQPQSQQPAHHQQTGGQMATSNASGFHSSTDGQIYTLTVLNGSEQWLKKEMTEQTPLPLDLDTLLGGFPGYIKSEYTYEDSGFGADNHHKADDILMGHHNPHHQQHLVGQPQHPHSPLATVTGNPNSNSNSTNLGAFHDPNNNSSASSSNNSSSAGSASDWQMTDHNAESTAESLLRSALQGKGYGLTVMGSPTSLNGGGGGAAGRKGDDELRRVMFGTEQESMGYADSTLTSPLFDDPSVVVGGNASAQNPSSLVTTSNLVHGMPHSTVHHHVDDDMFLSLDNAFPDDFEKIKRIATEVQQFCTSDVNNNSSGGGQQHQGGYLLHIDSNNNHSTPLSPTKMNSNGNNGQHSPLLLNLNGSAPGNSSPVVSIKGSGKLILGNSQNGNAGGNCPLSPYIINSPGGCQMSTGKGQPQQQPPTTPTTPTGTISNGKAKKYKRMNSSNSAAAANNNNNNNSSCSNLNLVAANGMHTSPVCSGQRKERSLHYCSICSKGFKDKYSVNVHIRTHTGEKPFSCSLCGKSFRQKAHLAKHYQTHMAQKNNNSTSGGGGGQSLKASKQQQQQQQQLQQQQQTQQIIASASTIIPLSSSQGGVVGGVVGSSGLGVIGQVSQQQLIGAGGGGMGPEINP